MIIQFFTEIIFLSILQEFDTFGATAAELDGKRAESIARSSNSSIPGPVPSELIVASNLSIGKRLLAKMGWKEGQGVGARSTLKKKMKQRDIKNQLVIANGQQFLLADGHAAVESSTEAIVPFSSAVVVADQKEVAKENNTSATSSAITIIHPGANISCLSSSALDIQGQITYAPINTMSLVIIPPPKADLFGIGYDPSIENPEISAFRNNGRSRNGQGVYRMDALSAKLGHGGGDSLTGRGMTGFALNDDEDDVYDNINSSSSSLRHRDQCEEDDSEDDHGMDSKKGRQGRKIASSIDASVNQWLESTVGDKER